MCKEKLSGSRRVKWTDEEKQLFTQGMVIMKRFMTLLFLRPLQIILIISEKGQNYTFDVIYCLSRGTTILKCSKFFSGNLR